METPTSRHTTSRAKHSGILAASPFTCKSKVPLSRKTSWLESLLKPCLNVPIRGMHLLPMSKLRLELPMNRKTCRISVIAGIAGAALSKSRAQSDDGVFGFSLELSFDLIASF